MKSRLSVILHLPFNQTGKDKVPTVGAMPSTRPLCACRDNLKTLHGHHYLDVNFLIYARIEAFCKLRLRYYHLLTRIALVSNEVPISTWLLQPRLSFTYCLNASTQLIFLFMGAVRAAKRDPPEIHLMSNRTCKIFQATGQNLSTSGDSRFCHQYCQVLPPNTGRQVIAHKCHFL